MVLLPWAQCLISVPQFPHRLQCWLRGRWAGPPAENLLEKQILGPQTYGREHGDDQELGLRATDIDHQNWAQSAAVAVIVVIFIHFDPPNSCQPFSPFYS